MTRHRTYYICYIYYLTGSADRCTQVYAQKNLESCKAFTYICIGTLVGSGTREGDKLMAPFVDHETANWEKRRKSREFYRNNLWHNIVSCFVLQVYEGHSTIKSASLKKNICIHKKVPSIQVSDKQLRDRRRHKEECTCPLSQTNASRQTDWNACVHPHSHPLKKCFCSSRLFTSCWGWYQLYHCLPLKWDPPIPKCHSAWHGWHDIWRCYQVSDSGIYIWTLPLIWRGGGSKNVDICDSWRVSWLPLRLSLSVPNSIFLLHCLKFFILSSLSILTQSVCFAHCQAACLLMCTTALSHYHICVVLSVILPAKPHSCQTIWQALVKQEKLVCCRPRNSRGFDWKAVVSFCWAN